MNLSESVPPHLEASPTVPWTDRDVWLGVSSFVIWIGAAAGWQFLTTHYEADYNAGLLVTLGELLLLVPVWLLAIYQYRVGWSTLGLHSFKLSMVGLGCGLMLASFTFNLLYSSFLAFFGQRMQADLSPIFAELASPWLFFIGGAVVAPVVEEIFFRGFIFAGLRPRYGWVKAGVISSLIFALLHLTLNAIIPIFILGFVFAYLYQVSGSIWPGILMHVLTNALALGGAYLLANAERYGLEITILFRFLGY